MPLHMNPIIAQKQIALIIFGLTCNLIFSQDIEPRRWSTIPVGTQVAGIGFVHTFGDIEFDPLLQAENTTLSVNSLALQYVRAFKIGTKLARIDVLIPYSNATWEGLLNKVPTTVKRNGFADPRLRFSLNILGPKAMTPKELQDYFKTNPTYTTFGASLSISFPLGQYYGDKLLNLGYNTFVFRPQIGMVHKWNSWSFEASGSVFFYSINNDFYINKTKRQDPLFALQTHLIKSFKNRIWASLSFGYGQGGNSIVNRVTNDDERGNFLGGVSAGMPIFKKQTLKLAYGSTLTTKDVGANTHGFVLGWAYIF